MEKQCSKAGECRPGCHAHTCTACCHTSYCNEALPWGPADTGAALAGHAPLTRLNTVLSLIVTSLLCSGI